MSPIEQYLHELAGALRHGRRRRILAEVRAHLLEAAAADRAGGADRDVAERGAVERFGPPAKVAGQFNAVRRRPLALVHRAAAVMLASVAMATLGTATVWAIEPGAAHSRAHAQTAGHVRPTRRSDERR
jgi:hypothetical protein